MARGYGKVKSRPDGGAGTEAEHGSGPLRTCIVTRQERAPDELIRFVLDPAGAVVPDVVRRLPGRGVWVTLSRDVLAKAIERKAFARGFRKDVTVAPDLVARVEAILSRRAIESLSLANKAGLVVPGFESVHRGIEADNVLCVVHGSDAAADGTEKIDRKFRAIRRDAGISALIVTSLTIDQLSLAIGRSPVVHALLGTGRAGDNFVRATERLIRFRSDAQQSLQDNEAATGGDCVAAGAVDPGGG